ncbi:MAG: glyoxalase [Ilumatobacteraceae bacterium]|nr:glyoxalase [Ilumatobacteraceae bacterium]
MPVLGRGGFFFRANDPDGLIDQLVAAGVEVTTKPEWNDPSVGQFARIHDPDGNAIELWEPPRQEA